MKNTSWIFIFVFLCACSSLVGKFLENPKIELQNVSVQDINFSGCKLMFHLKVENPNKVDIKVDEVNYKIYLNDKEVTTTKTESSVTIPAKSEALVDLPLPVEYQKIWPDLKDLFEKKSATYKIEGSAKLPFVTLPFTKEGKIDLNFSSSN